MAEQTTGPEAGEAHDEVDPELVEMAQERARGSVLKPLIYASVIVLGVWIVGDWTTELQYFFSDSDPVEVGTVTEFAEKRKNNPDWTPDLPHNRYVSLEGIPSRRAESRRHRYFKLVGAHVYVEEPVENAEQPLESGTTGQPDLSEVDRTYFEGAGRLISFARMPDRYQGVRKYFRNKYGTRFCEQLEPADRERLRRRRRAKIVESWKKEYQNASPEERKEKGLTPKPTDEQIEEILESRDICVDAHLLRAGVAPGDHWWYVALAGVFGIFMLVNLYWLVRWFQAFFGIGYDPRDAIEDEASD